MESQILINNKTTMNFIKRNNSVLRDHLYHLNFLAATSCIENESEEVQKIIIALKRMFGNVLKQDNIYTEVMLDHDRYKISLNPANESAFLKEWSFKNEALKVIACYIVAILLGKNKKLVVTDNKALYYAIKRHEFKSSLQYLPYTTNKDIAKIVPALATIVGNRHGYSTGSFDKIIKFIEQNLLD